MFIKALLYVLPIIFTIILCISGLRLVENTIIKGSGIEYGRFGYKWALDLHKKNKKRRDEKNNN
jgi:hypothetical protein